jgi:hypothetical protein
MTNVITRITARLAFPVVCAGLIGTAALGFAGAAGAATSIDPHGPNFNAPSVTAHPAPDAAPGTHYHHRTAHLQNLVPGYHP